MDMKVAKVAIIDHTESLDGRVHLLKHFFESKGIKTDVIMSDFSHYKKKKIIHAKKGYIYLHTIPYRKNVSVKRILSHIYFAKKVFHFLCQSNYDLVWVLLPPNSLLKEVVKAKRIKHFLLIGDVEDLWPESLPIQSDFLKRMLVFKYWKNLRNDNLQYADYVVTECEAYLPYLKKYIKSGRSTTLFLAKPSVSKIKDLSSKCSNILRVAYVGSINHIIDINSIQGIIERLSKIKKVEVVIIGDGESRQKLIETLESIKNVQVHFYGKIFDERKKQSILRDCNMGINIMKESVVVGFTMKSLDYLRNGLLLLNNIHNDTWQLVEKYDIGINVGSSARFINQEVQRSFSLKQRNYIIDLYNNLFSEKSFFDNVNNICVKLGINTH